MGALLLAAIAAPVPVLTQGHDGGVDVTISRPPPEKPRCLLLIPKIHPRRATMYDEMRESFEQAERQERKEAAVQGINDLRDAIARLNHAAARLEATQEEVAKQVFDDRRMQLLNVLEELYRLFQSELNLPGRYFGDLRDLGEQITNQLARANDEIERCPLKNSAPRPQKPRCLLSIPGIHPAHLGMYDLMRTRWPRIEALKETRPIALQAINGLQDAVLRLHTAATKLEDTQRRADKQVLDQHRGEVLRLITQVRDRAGKRFYRPENRDLADLEKQVKEHVARTEAEIERCPLLD